MTQEQVKFFKGTQEQIEQAPIKEGSIYIASDTKKMFTDLGNERFKIGGDSNVDQLKENLTNLIADVSRLDATTIQKNGTKIIDLSWANLYKISQEAPGTYLVGNEATNGPEAGKYGNILIAYSNDNRFVAILAYDNGHVYAQYASDTTRWIRIDTTADAFTGVLSTIKGGTGCKKGVFGTTGTNPIASNAEDTVLKWVTIVSGTYWITIKNLMTGQDLQYGYLLHINNGSNVGAQIFLPVSQQALYYRTFNGAQNNNGPMPAFRKILNSSGVVPVNSGGTGATTAEGILSMLFPTPNPTNTGTAAYIPTFGGNNFSPRGYYGLPNLRQEMSIYGDKAFAANGDPIHYCRIGNYQIVNGVIPPFDLAGNSIASKKITFLRHFATQPQVVACLQSDSQSYTFGWCNVTTVNRTTTNITLKFFNGDSSTRNMCARIIAFGECS